MADAPGSTTEVNRRVQVVEGLEHTLGKAAPNSPEAAGALAKMQTEIASENATKGANPDISAQVVKQLQADHFSNVTLDKNGNMVFNSTDQAAAHPPTDQAAGNAPTDQTAVTQPTDGTTTAATHTPDQSDFIKFAQMLTKVQSGQTVDAKDFASVFGAQDAAILQSMGLQNIANANGRYTTGFAQAGSIPFGSDTLEFQKTASFNLSTNSSGEIDLSNISGLKGKEGALNPNLTKVAISSENPTTDTWNVDATGKVAFVSGDQKLVVKDSPPTSLI